MSKKDLIDQLKARLSDYMQLNSNYHEAIAALWKDEIQIYQINPQHFSDLKKLLIDIGLPIKPPQCLAEEKDFCRIDVEHAIDLSASIRMLEDKTKPYILVEQLVELRAQSTNINRFLDQHPDADPKVIQEMQTVISDLNDKLAAVKLNHKNDQKFTGRLIGMRESSSHLNVIQRRRSERLKNENEPLSM